MLTEQERERYARQILLFGEEGQERLKKAKVFIAGAGGLGCPIALYLAVAVAEDCCLLTADTRLIHALKGTALAPVVRGLGEGEKV